MSLLICILVIWASLYLLSCLFFWTAKDKEFWKRGVAALSNKVVNFYCKATPAKVMIWVLRVNSVGYAAYAFGFPAIEAVKNNESYWLALKWNEVDSLVLIIYLAINMICACIFFTTQRIMPKDLKELNGKVTGISDMMEETSANVKQLLLSANGDMNVSMILKSCREIIKDIDSLRFKSAQSHLVGINETYEEFGRGNKTILAKIRFGEACAFRFTNLKKALSKYKEAFNLANGTIMTEEIAEGYLMAMCYEGKEREIDLEADCFSCLECSSPWRFIPLFIGDCEKVSFFDRYNITDTELQEDILAESGMILKYREEVFNIGDFSAQSFFQVHLGC